MLIDYHQLHLPVTRLVFHSIARSFIDLPEYSGSAFRGSFGTAFKKICCTMPQRSACHDCPFLAECAYANIFETPQQGQIPLQATNLPHPFVFEPPQFSQRAMLEPGEPFSCSMVLIGRAMDHFYQFVLVWNEMGKIGLGRGRGRFLLDRVVNENQQTLYQSSTGLLHRQLFIRDCADFLQPSPQTITVTFTTPLRITEYGDLSRNLTFPLFWRNLLRRASLLAKLYSAQEWALDYQTILQTAENISTANHQLQWYDWERFSNRQNRRMKLGGLIGNITFTGDLSLFYPLIQHGTYFHVGKNTTFGMGKYILNDQAKQT